MISQDQVLSAKLQECRLYRIYVWDPRTDYTTQTLGYVGETLRLPFTRWLEHVYEQPWADTIAALVVDEQVFPSKGAVLAAEEATVRAERPLFNVEFNMGNPDRVKPWEAKEQALDRQRRGTGTASRPSPRLSGGTPAVGTVRRPTPQPAVVKPPARRSASSSRPATAQSGMRLVTDRPWFWWSVLWFLLAVAGGSASYVKLAMPGNWAAGAGVGAASLLVGLMLPARRRRRRRRS